MSELSRAVEYRRMMNARARWECDQRYRAFPGDEVSAATVRAQWLALTDLERAWDPLLDCSGEPLRGRNGVARDGLQVA